MTAEKAITRRRDMFDKTPADPAGVLSLSIFLQASAVVRASSKPRVIFVDLTMSAGIEELPLEKNGGPASDALRRPAAEYDRVRPRRHK